MSAIPQPDPASRKQRIILSGDVPSALSPPTGCSFHTRCLYAQDRCRKEEPVLRVASSGPGSDPSHRVACHFHDRVPAAVAVVEPEKGQATTKFTERLEAYEAAKARRIGNGTAGTGV